jgi:hypothetical protein
VPPWTSFPGAPGLSETLFIEAFGQLTRDTNEPGIVSEEQDLWSVFMARGDLMGWSAMWANSSRPPDSPPPALWSLEEAELTHGDDSSRIGWAQVGLEHGVEPAMALPALVQCFDDSLRRFGDVELTALQVTATQLQPSTVSPTSALISALNWFHTSLKGTAHAIIAFDNEMVGGGTEVELVAGLQQLYTAGAFEFGPLVAVPEQQSIHRPLEMPVRAVTPAQRGVSVRLLEWTASTAGWVLALVIDTARAAAPEVGDFTVRMTRVEAQK